MSPSETHGPMMPPPLLRSDHGLFLDFDGTLADLQEDASAVVLPQSGPQTLRRVSDALSGALAIISGRALADLSLRVPIEAECRGFSDKFSEQRVSMVVGCFVCHK